MRLFDSNNYKNYNKVAYNNYINYVYIQQMKKFDNFYNSEILWYNTLLYHKPTFQFHFYFNFNHKFFVKNKKF